MWKIKLIQKTIDNFPYGIKILYQSGLQSEKHYLINTYKERLVTQGLTCDCGSWLVSSASLLSSQMDWSLSSQGRNSGKQHNHKVGNSKNNLELRSMSSEFQQGQAKSLSVLIASDFEWYMCPVESGAFLMALKHTHLAKVLEKLKEVPEKK